MFCDTTKPRSKGLRRLFSRETCSARLASVAARASPIPITGVTANYPVGLRSQGMGVADSRTASGKLSVPSTARRPMWTELKNDISARRKTAGGAVC